MNPVRNSQWYTYVLYSKKDKFLYIGCTKDLIKRLKEHNNGEVFSTRNRLPLKLIYYEVGTNSGDAYSREKYLKSGMGKRYIKNRLKSYFISINKVNF